jgi:DNA-directed RNA polymerase subunit RPC12/RpoP
MRTLGCAGCGSTLEPKTDGACPNCGAARQGGLLQWEAFRIGAADLRPLAPVELHLGGGVEPGTERPNSYAPDLASARREFEARHPDHSWPAFEARVRSTFERLQRAWSSGEWEFARPHETDALFQLHRFWVERYSRLGLRNRVDQLSVARVVPCEIGLDAFYEWIVVRIFASALDWTEDAEGRVVGGSRDETRSFSEYWTFLRAAGAGRPTAGDPSACPSCGAPLDRVNMAGVCEYCGSKLTTGNFDWVVSKIEQD